MLNIGQFFDSFPGNIIPILMVIGVVYFFGFITIKPFLKAVSTMNRLKDNRNDIDYDHTDDII